MTTLRYIDDVCLVNEVSITPARDGIINEPSMRQSMNATITIRGGLPLCFCADVERNCNESDRELSVYPFPQQFDIMDSVVRNLGFDPRVVKNSHFDLGAAPNMGAAKAIRAVLMQKRNEIVPRMGVFVIARYVSDDPSEDERRRIVFADNCNWIKTSWRLRKDQLVLAMMQNRSLEGTLLSPAKIKAVACDAYAQGAEGPCCYSPEITMAMNNDPLIVRDTPNQLGVSYVQAAEMRVESFRAALRAA